MQSDVNANMHHERDNDITHEGCKVELVSSSDGISELEPEWRSLIAESATQHAYFQSPDWCLNWLKCNPDAKPVIVTARQQGRLAMVLPLMVKHNFGIGVLEILSGADSEYATPVFSPNADERQVFQTVLGKLRETAGFDLLRLNSVPEDFSVCTLAQKRYRLESGLEYSSIIEISDFANLDDYLSSLSKSSRRSLRRKMQNFEKLGDVEAVVKPVTDNYKSDIFPTICHWKREWFAENGVLGGNFNRSDMEEQLSGLCKSDGQSPPALATELRLDGELVACDVMLQGKSVLYSYVTARDLKYHKYGIGSVMDMHTISHAIGNGFKAIDLLVGPNPSKDSMANKKVTVVDLRFALSGKGSIQANIDRLRMRDQIKTAFYLLPLSIRQSILKLRS